VAAESKYMFQTFKSSGKWGRDYYFKITDDSKTLDVSAFRVYAVENHSQTTQTMKTDPATYSETKWNLY